MCISGQNENGVESGFAAHGRVFFSADPRIFCGQMKPSNLGMAVVNDGQPAIIITVMVNDGQPLLTIQSLTI